MLGEKYENNKKNKGYQPNVYSRYVLANSESPIDPSKASFTFWNGLLKVAVAPFIESKSEYDYDNEGAVYLSHFKAKALLEDLKVFIKDMEKINSVGVPTKDGLLSVSNGIEIHGELKPCIIIRKLDEDGSVKSSYMYEFKSSYHYTIRNFEEGGSFDKIFHDNLELLLFMDLLDEYYRATSGAYAYSNMDYGRFGNSIMNTKLDSIAEKLGIEYKGKKNYGGNKGKSNSVFDGAKGRSYESKGLDDIDELI